MRLLEITEVFCTKDNPRAHEYVNEGIPLNCRQAPDPLTMQASKLYLWIIKQQKTTFYRLVSYRRRREEGMAYWLAKCIVRFYASLLFQHCMIEKELCNIL